LLCSLRDAASLLCIPFEYVQVRRRNRASARRRRGLELSSLSRREGREAMGMGMGLIVGMGAGEPVGASSRGVATMRPLRLSPLKAPGVAFWDWRQFRPRAFRDQKGRH
jgi:hypothetical protein